MRGSIISKRVNMDAINSFRVIADIMAIQWEPCQLPGRHSENINTNLSPQGFFMYHRQILIEIQRMKAVKKVQRKLNVPLHGS
ncbi:hypothetical protein SRABI80_04910 [Peribacillus frigoritolerans]|nr:hypothetical protein SRABI80_04910 [Peribacillus frigoritolerans]